MLCTMGKPDAEIDERSYFSVAQFASGWYFGEPPLACSISCNGCIRDFARH